MGHRRRAARDLASEQLGGRNGGGHVDRHRRSGLSWRCCRGVAAASGASQGQARSRVKAAQMPARDCLQPFDLADECRRLPRPVGKGSPGRRAAPPGNMTFTGVGIQMAASLSGHTRLPTDCGRRRRPNDCIPKSRTHLSTHGSQCRSRRRRPMCSGLLSFPSRGRTHAVRHQAVVGPRHTRRHERRLYRVLRSLNPNEAVLAASRTAFLPSPSRQSCRSRGPVEPRATRGTHATVKTSMQHHPNCDARQPKIILNWRGRRSR